MKLPNIIKYGKTTVFDIRTISKSETDPVASKDVFICKM